MQKFLKIVIYGLRCKRQISFNKRSIRVVWNNDLIHAYNDPVHDHFALFLLCLTFDKQDKIVQKRKEIIF